MTDANYGTAPALDRKHVRPSSRIWLYGSGVITSVFVAGIIFWLHSPSQHPKLLNRTQITRDGLPKTTVLSDGRYLYLSETAQGRHIISKVSTDGSSPSKLSLPFAGEVGYGIAPDRSSLLLSARNESQEALWTVPLSSGSAYRLPITGRNATWAPDGRRIAYVYDSALWVGNRDGTDAREIAKVDGTVFYPRFSPDGRRIRFSVGNTVQNSSTSSLWEVGADGTGLHALFSGWHDPPGECCGSWTSDGRYYIFQVSQSRPANVTNLWALAEPVRRSYRKPPTNPIQLTNGPMSFGMASPDPGRNDKLWALGVQPAGEFVKYDPASKRFISLLPGVSGTDLDFSRDGEWVAYVAIPEGTLWRCRADGSDRLQLSSQPQRAALPRWSPDGKQLVFMSVETGSTWKLLVVAGAGGTPRPLIAGDRNQVDANWSPDGTRIVFGDEWSAKNPAIQVLDLKSGQTSTISGSRGLFSPRWSPNGRYIAALSVDFTTLMLFDFQAQKWSPWLVEPAGAVSYPSWSPDSRHLYFEDLVTGEDSIRRIKVGSTKPESVFVLKTLDRYPGAFGLWHGRAADGSQLFVRDRSTQEVYGLDLDLP